MKSHQREPIPSWVVRNPTVIHRVISPDRSMLSTRESCRFTSWQVLQKLSCMNSCYAIVVDILSLNELLIIIEHVDAVQKEINSWIQSVSNLCQAPPADVDNLSEKGAIIPPPARSVVLWVQKTVCVPESCPLFSATFAGPTKTSCFPISLSDHAWPTW